MDKGVKYKIHSMLQDIEENGLKWKSEDKRIQHLITRKDYGHIPDDFLIKDYESLILNLINGNETEIYLYYIHKQNYIVFGDRISQWIAIIGEDHIIDTAFLIDTTTFDEYLSEKDGYIFLGKLKEVIE